MIGPHDPEPRHRPRAPTPTAARRSSAPPAGHSENWEEFDLTMKRERRTAIFVILGPSSLPCSEAVAGCSAQPDTASLGEGCDDGWLGAR